MGSYSLVVKKSAERELRGLAHDLCPSGHEKVSGQEQYRVRQGDYRVVCAIDDDHRILTIAKIGHRREVYC